MNYIYIIIKVLFLTPAWSIHGTEWILLFLPKQEDLKTNCFTIIIILVWQKYA